MRANHKIRVPQVRCIAEDGTMLGVVQTRDAMRMAQERGLDLVEISPNADPPVCRIMDFGKYRYDESVKRKLARKQAHLHNRSIKEIKFHPNVGEHDYGYKIKHVRGFLGEGHKVKLTLTFRGREMAHRDLGFGLIQRVVKDCADICVVEMDPKMMGRSITGMLAPKQGKTTGGPAASAPPVRPAQAPPPARPAAAPSPQAPSPAPAAAPAPAVGAPTPAPGQQGA